MGRYSYSYRGKADEIRNVSISWLNKNGYVFRKGNYRSGGISWTSSFSGVKNSISVILNFLNEYPTFTFSYNIIKEEGEKKKIEYKVNLVSTKCNFGGERYWFECPIYKNGVYCGRRVAKMYMKGDYFSCRHCGNLTYSSRFIPKDTGLRLLHKMFDRDDRIKKLEKQIKNKYYQGRPTRKYRRLLYYRNEFDSGDAMRIIQDGLFATKRVSLNLNP